MLEFVPKAGSILIIALLLIAYGRCVADQYSLLYATDISCCQTVCDVNECCSNVIDKSCSDHSPSDQKNEKPDQNDTPAPCQLCLILDNESMQITCGVKVPHPVYSECMNCLDFVTDTSSPTSRFLNSSATTSTVLNRPSPPAELCLLFHRMAPKAIPVRGPSITS